jgi:hypothetical protein
MCCPAPLESSLIATSILKAIKNYDGDCIATCALTKTVDGKTVPSVRAYVLPRGVAWPTFQTNKQEGVPVQNLLYVQDSVVANNRLNMTIDNLKQLFDTAWIGAPGIGKSHSINVILMNLLDRLRRSEDWPKKVLLRLPDIVYVFALEGDRVAVREHRCPTLNDAEAFSKQFRRTNDVILMELGEKESDPIPKIPTLVTLSATGANDGTKTLLKRGFLSRYLVVPYEHVQDMENILDLVFAVDRESASRAFGCSDYQSELLKRFNVFGGNPRTLTSGKVYEDALGTIKSKEELGEVFANIRNMTIFDVPGSLKYFAAAVLKPGVEFPDAAWDYDRSAPSLFANTDTAPPSSERGTRNHVYRFHSDYVAKLVADAINGPLDVALLRSYGLRWQVHEAMVLRCMLLKPDQTPSTKEASFRESLEWYPDVGFKTELCRDHALVSKDVPGLADIPLCSHVIQYCDRYLRKSVSGLVDGVVYRSTDPQAPLRDFEFVNHRTKTLYVVQVSSSKPEDHPFSVKVCTEYIEHLFLSDRDKEYKVVLIYVTTNQEAKMKGLKFTDSVDKTDTSKFDSLTLDELKQRNPKAERISTAFIIRADLDMLGSGVSLPDKERYSKMLKPVLTALCKDRRIVIPKTALKADIISLLQKSDSSIVK